MSSSLQAWRLSFVKRKFLLFWAALLETHVLDKSEVLCPMVLTGVSNDEMTTSDNLDGHLFPGVLLNIL